MNEFYSLAKRRQESRELGKRNEKKRLAVAAVVSLIAHAGIVFHDEVLNAPKKMGRLVEQIENRADRQEYINVLLSENHILDKEGSPMNVDLSDFHFEYEHLAGGIDEEQSEKAKREYEHIIEKATELKQSDEDFQEVLGYILKQQGDYDPDHSLLSDFMITHEGNCEARQKFISSALQDLYPEMVESGKVYLETFRPYVDEAGDAHRGHVRVVVQENDNSLLVLEGDSVKEENPTEHENIRKIEVTRATVQGALAAAGEFSFDSPEKTDKAQPDMPGFLDSISLSTDSIMVYPGSNAIYVSRNGLTNIDPNPIEGFYSGSHQNPMEIRFLQEPNEESISASKFYNPVTDSFCYPVYQWNLTDEVKDSLHNVLKKGKLYKYYGGTVMLDGYQSLNREFVDSLPGIQYAIMGTPSPETWGDTKVYNLALIDPGDSLPDIKNLPLRTDGRAELEVDFTFPEREEEEEQIIKEFIVPELRNGINYRFKGGPDINIVLPPEGAVEQPSSINLVFIKVGVPALTNRNFNSLSIGLKQNQPLRLAGSHIKHMDLTFPYSSAENSFDDNTEDH